MLNIGQRAPDFGALPGVDGGRHSLASFAAKPVLVLIFTGNGCPTAKANEERLVALQAIYEPKGVQLVAINSNNPSLSPPDTMAEMVARARAKRFNFPYLKDEDGHVARAFGAENTPHAFVLDQARKLRYKGRIDDSRDPAKATHSDLEAALADVLANRAVRVPETQPFGCAIVS